MSKTVRNGQGGYVQLFVYRIPKGNRDSMQELLKDIAEMLKRHGTLFSEFYRLFSPEAFQGFTTIFKTFSNGADEELWIELDHYVSREQRDHAMIEIGKDSGAELSSRSSEPWLAKDTVLSWASSTGS
jgi:uncharacterized protein YbaA (DUF1428 family)